jgi:hypothetical protein
MIFEFKVKGKDHLDYNPDATWEERPAVKWSHNDWNEAIRHAKQLLPFVKEVRVNEEGSLQGHYFSD